MKAKSITYQRLAFALLAMAGLMLMVACGGSSGTNPTGNQAATPTTPTYNTPKFLVAPDDTAYGTKPINIFSVNPTTGSLSKLASTSYFDAGANGSTGIGYPYSVVAHPVHGNWIYVADDANCQISAVSLGADGTPTLTNSQTAAWGCFYDSNWGGIGNMTITPDGKYLYAIPTESELVSSFAINQSTGALMHVSDIETDELYYLNEGWDYSYDLTAIAATSKFVYFTGADEGGYWNLFTLQIDANGALSAIDTVPPMSVGDQNGYLHGAKIDRSGQYLYVGQRGGTNQLFGFKIQADGSLLPLNAGIPLTQPSETNAYVHDIAFSLDNKFIYVNGDTSGVHVLSFDATTGAASELASSPYTTDSQGNSIDAYGSIVTDPSNKFVYVNNSYNSNIVAYQRDTTTGKLTPVGETSTNNSSSYGIAVTF